MFPSLPPREDRLPSVQQELHGLGAKPEPRGVCEQGCSQMSLRKETSMFLKIYFEFLHILKKKTTASKC